VADIEKLVKVVFRGDDQITRAIDSIDRRLTSWSGGIADITSPLAGMADGLLKADAALAALAAGGLALAFEKSRQFETALVDLRKVLSEDEIPALGEARQAAVDLSETYGQSATDILQSTANFKQAGFDVQESMQLTKTAMDLVVAGGLDASRASDLLVASLKGFKEPASEAGRLVDILNEVSNQYATNVEELAEGMAGLSPIAKTMGFSMEETAGILTPVIEVFRSGDEAAIALKTGLLKLIDDTPTVRNALESIGVSQTNANGSLRSGKEILADVAKAFLTLDENQKLYVTQQLVGIDQSARMVEVFNQLGKTTEVTAVAMGAAGSAAKEVAARLATADVAVGVFKASWENLAVTVGDQFRAAAVEAIEGGSEIAQALRTSVDDGSFAPVFEALQRFASGVGDFLSDVAQSLPEALSNVDFSELVRALGGVGDEIQGLFEGIDLRSPEGLTRAIQAVVDTIESLASTTAGMVSAFGPVFSTIRSAIGAYNDLDSSTKEAAGSTIGISKVVNLLIEPFQGALHAVTAFTVALYSIGAGTTITAISSISRALGSAGLTAAAGSAAVAFAPFAVGGAVAAGIIYVADKISDALLPAVREIPPEVPMAVTMDGTGAIKTVEEVLAQAEAMNAEIELALKLGGPDDAQRMARELLLEGENNEKQIDYVLNPSTETLSAAIVEMGGFVITEADRAARKASEKIAETTKQIATETYEWFDAEGQRHAITVEVNDKKIDEAKKKVEEIPTEKQLEIKLQGEIDERLARIKAEADIIQTKVEWEAKLEIADIEAQTKRLETTFESINTTIESTGETILGLFGELDGKTTTEKWKIEAAIEKELAMRQRAADMQEALTLRQIEYMDAKNRLLQQGQAAIKVEVDGVYPELDVILMKLIERAQIKASEEGLESLLGLPAVA
jgi:TP901 family phage tail tape measure protein